MPHCCVMAWRMMFGKKIRFVGFAWAPVNEEVSLACSIIDPIESHIHCLGFLALELKVPKAVGLSVSIGVGGC